MDTGTELRHLALANKHITEGLERIARQKQMVVKLVVDGHAEAARRAADVLAGFCDTLEIMRSHRLLIVSELRRHGIEIDLHAREAIERRREQMLAGFRNSGGYRLGTRCLEE